MTHQDDSINNPHDQFTRRILSDIDNVRELVTWRMPAEVLAELKLDSIRPANQSFVDRLLREGLSALSLKSSLHGVNRLTSYFYLSTSLHPTR